MVQILSAVIAAISGLAAALIASGQIRIRRVVKERLGDVDHCLELVERQAQLIAELQRQEGECMERLRRLEVKMAKVKRS